MLENAEMIAVVVAVVLIIAVFAFLSRRRGRRVRVSGSVPRSARGLDAAGERMVARSREDQS